MNKLHLKHGQDEADGRSSNFLQIVYALTPSQNREKFDEKGHKLLFIVHINESKGYNKNYCILRCSIWQKCNEGSEKQASCGLNTISIWRTITISSCSFWNSQYWAGSSFHYNKWRRKWLWKSSKEEMFIKRNLWLKVGWMQWKMKCPSLRKTKLGKLVDLPEEENHWAKMNYKIKYKEDG